MPTGLCSVSPVYLIGGVGLCVTAQVALTVCGIYLQWVNCEFSFTNQFSFGLHSVIINFHVSLMEFELGQVNDYVSQAASVIPGGSQNADDFGALVSASSAIMGTMIAGGAFALFALFAACLSLASLEKLKRYNKQVFFNWCAGFLLFGGLLVLLSVMIYSSAVQPRLRDLGIAGVIQSIYSAIGQDLDFITSRALEYATACTSQRTMGGQICAIISGVISLSSGFVLFMVSVESEGEGRGFRFQRWDPKGKGKGKGKGKDKGKDKGKGDGKGGQVEMMQMPPSGGYGGQDYGKGAGYGQGAGYGKGAGYGGAPGGYAPPQAGQGPAGGYAAPTTPGYGGDYSGGGPPQPGQGPAGGYVAPTTPGYGGDYSGGGGDGQTWQPTPQAQAPLWQAKRPSQTQPQSQAPYQPPAQGADPSSGTAEDPMTPAW